MKSFLLVKWWLVLLLIGGYAQVANSQSSSSPRVHGHVYDEKGERIPQAMFMLKEVGIGGPDTPFAVAMGREDGSFEIDTTTDSVLLIVSRLGHKTVEMKVARDCEIDIYMERDDRWDGDIIIGDPPAIPRRHRTGYIFDDKGKPVDGANILIKEKDINIDKENSSNNDGSFDILGSDFAELTISVEGHQPLKIDFQSLNKRNESELIKHDGLFIVIDFNW